MAHLQSGGFSSAFRLSPKEQLGQHTGGLSRRRPRAELKSRRVGRLAREEADRNGDSREFSKLANETLPRSLPEPLTAYGSEAFLIKSSL